MSAPATAAPAGGDAAKPRKRWALLLGVGAVLVTGAVLAGVLGSRAQKTKRRPIQVEEITYHMVTEGLLPASTVSLADTLNQIKQQQQPQQNASGAATTVMTPVTPVAATKAPTASSGSNSFFSMLTGGGSSSAGGSSTDASAMVLPEGAVVAPSWKQVDNANKQYNMLGGGLDAAAANGRVLCYPKTGKDVIEMASMEYPSACDVLVFTNDQFTPYQIDHTLNISRPLLFLGNPLRSPMLNSTNRIVRLVDGKGLTSYPRTSLCRLPLQHLLTFVVSLTIHPHTPSHPSPQSTPAGASRRAP